MYIIVQNIVRFKILRKVENCLNHRRTQDFGSGVGGGGGGRPKDTRNLRLNVAKKHRKIRRKNDHIFHSEASISLKTNAQKKKNK